ncbi:hypothetical protein HIM_00843 [Hirsutella minnesotensis 3608]|nr:hypothetical protein HIM_00843 [Hirsutella minnesotensis 3608]
MEYLHSTLIDPSMYETKGLCDGIPVCKSKYTWLEDRSAIRAQHDWDNYVQPCCQYRGTLGPEHSFMSVATPECVPERLEIMSYANEFAFLHDDITDDAGKEIAEIENDDMLETFLEVARIA